MRRKRRTVGGRRDRSSQKLQTLVPSFWLLEHTQVLTELKLNILNRCMLYRLIIMLYSGSCMTYYSAGQAIGCSNVTPKIILTFT